MAGIKVKRFLTESMCFIEFLQCFFFPLPSFVIGWKLTGMKGKMNTMSTASFCRRMLSDGCKKKVIVSGIKFLVFDSGNKPQKSGEWKFKYLAGRKL